MRDLASSLQNQNTLTPREIEKLVEREVLENSNAFNRRLKEMEGTLASMKGFELQMEDKMRAMRESEFEMK